jgi:hypothetical protein
MSSRPIPLFRYRTRRSRPVGWLAAGIVILLGSVIAWLLIVSLVIRVAP